MKKGGTVAKRQEKNRRFLETKRLIFAVKRPELPSRSSKAPFGGTGGRWKGKTKKTQRHYRDSDSIRHQHAEEEVLQRCHVKGGEKKECEEEKKKMCSDSAPN